LTPEDIPLMARLAGSALASKAAGYVAQRYQAGVAQPRAVKWSSLIGCNMAFRRTVLEEIGGFDPKFWPGEEMLAAFRATRRGHQLIFHSGAALYHYPRQTLAGFVRQMFGYGATRIRLIRAGVDFEPTTLVPALLVLSLPGLAIGACFLPWVGFLLALEILLYMGVCLTCAILKIFETRCWVDGLIFFVIPLMHVSYGFAEWVEWFRPNKDLSGSQ
jgi:GT2 family glycosyltransferase